MAVPTAENIRQNAPGDSRSGEQPSTSVSQVSTSANLQQPIHGGASSDPSFMGIQRPAPCANDISDLAKGFVFAGRQPTTMNITRNGLPNTAPLALVHDLNGTKQSHTSPINGFESNECSQIPQTADSPFPASIKDQSSSLTTQSTAKSSAYPNDKSFKTTNPDEVVLERQRENLRKETNRNIPELGDTLRQACDMKKVKPQDVKSSSRIPLDASTSVSRERSSRGSRAQKAHVGRTEYRDFRNSHSPPNRTADTIEKDQHSKTQATNIALPSFEPKGDAISQISADDGHVDTQDDHKVDGRFQHPDESPGNIQTLGEGFDGSQRLVQSPTAKLMNGRTRSETVDYDRHDLTNAGDILRHDVVAVDKQNAILVSDDEKEPDFSPTQDISVGDLSMSMEQQNTVQVPRSEPLQQKLRGRSRIPRASKRKQKDITHQLHRPAKVSKPNAKETRAPESQLPGPPPESEPQPPAQRRTETQRRTQAQPEPERIGLEAPVNLREVQQEVERYEKRQLWKFAKETEDMAEGLNEELNASENRNQKLAAEVEALRTGAAERTRASKAKKTDLTIRFQKMQNFLNGLTNDQHALKREILEKKNDLEDLRVTGNTMRASLKDATDSVKTTAEDNRRAIATYRERVVELEACLREKGNELQRIESRATPESGLKQVFESEMSRLRESMDRTSQLFAGYKKEFVEKLIRYDKSLQKAAGDSTVVNAGIISEVEKVNQAVGRLSGTISGSGTEQKKSFGELEYGMRTLVATMKDLAANSGSSNALEKLAETTSLIAASIIELKTSLAEERSSYELESGLRQELATTIERLNNVQEALQSSESENTKLYDGSQELRTRVEELNRETHRLKQDLETARQTQSEHTRFALESLQATVEGLKSELIGAQNDLNNKLHEHEIEKQKLQGTVEDLQHQLSTACEGIQADEQEQTASFEARIEEEAQKIRGELLQACQADKRAFGEQCRREIQIARKETAKLRLAASGTQSQAQTERNNFESAKREVASLRAEIEILVANAAGEAKRIDKRLSERVAQIKRDTKDMLEKHVLNDKTYDCIDSTFEALVQNKRHADKEPERLEAQVTAAQIALEHSIKTDLEVSLLNGDVYNDIGAVIAAITSMKKHANDEDERAKAQLHEKERTVKAALKLKLESALLNGETHDSLEAIMESLVRKHEHAAGELARTQAKVQAKEDDMTTKMRQMIQTLLPKDHEHESLEHAFGALTTTIESLRNNHTGETQNLGNLGLSTHTGEAQDFANINLLDQSQTGDTQDMAALSIGNSQHTNVAELEQELLALDEVRQELRGTETVAHQDTTLERQNTFFGSQLMSTDAGQNMAPPIATPARLVGSVSLETLQNSASPIGDTRGMFHAPSSRPVSNHGVRRSTYSKTPEPSQYSAIEQGTDVRRTMEALRNIPRPEDGVRKSGDAIAGQSKRALRQPKATAKAAPSRRASHQAVGRQQSSLKQSRHNGYEAEAESQQIDTQTSLLHATTGDSSDLSSLHTDIEDDECEDTQLGTARKINKKKDALDRRHEADADDQRQASKDNLNRQPSRPLKRPSASNNSLPNKTPKTSKPSKGRVSLGEMRRSRPIVDSPAPRPGGTERKPTSKSSVTKFQQRFETFLTTETTHEA